MVLNIRPITEGSGSPSQPIGRRISQHNPVDGVGNQQLPGHSGPDRPSPENQRLHQRSWGPASGRQPPARRGTPELPRNRRVAAVAAAVATAAKARLRVRMSWG